MRINVIRIIIFCALITGAFLHIGGCNKSSGRIYKTSSHLLLFPLSHNPILYSAQTVNIILSMSFSSQTPTLLHG